MKKIKIILLVFLVVSCQSNLTNKDEKELLERRVLEKRVLTKKLKEKQQKKTNSNSNNSSSHKEENVDINGSNIFSVTVENKGFFDIEIPKYTVIIKRTTDLNGKYVYDTERKITHTSGFFGNDCVWYDATYGYYDVEYYGYDKYGKIVFSKKFGNVLHKCHTVGTFYTKTDWNSPNVYCF